MEAWRIVGSRPWVIQKRWKEGSFHQFLETHEIFQSCKTKCKPGKKHPLCKDKPGRFFQHFLYINFPHSADLSFLYFPITLHTLVLFFSEQNVFFICKICKRSFYSFQKKCYLRLYHNECHRFLYFQAIKAKKREN